MRPTDSFHLVYSNAALHWLGDHERLFVELTGLPAEGGVLAAQMPANFAEPSHTAIEQTVRDGPWRDVLEPLLRPTPVGSAQGYFDILAPHLAHVDI